jgi:malonyl CoA-acyl carrier protein transacylase
VALVFPGQGSQRAGMAKDFHEQFAVAREAFAEASEALGLDVGKLCFEEDPRLDLTEFTQPAILTAEIAMTRALGELGLRGTRFGGHSLGEYTALCAAGVLPLATAVKIVRRRGALMQVAVPAGQGAMAAIIAEGIADLDLAAKLEPLGVDVANRNAQNQVVISGPAAPVEEASRRMPELLGDLAHRVVPLNVSAPFHSRMMRVIEDEFRALLGEAGLDAARASAVTSNFTGGFHGAEPAALVDHLTRQISGTVRWIENMQALIAGSGAIFEVGPNRPLKGFFKTAGKDIASIISVKAAEKELGA